MSVRHQLPNGPPCNSEKHGLSALTSNPTHVSQFTLQSGDSGETGLLTNVELTALFAFR